MVAALVVIACNDKLVFDPQSTVPCMADLDCHLATLHCDSVSEQCVACTTDAHCTALGMPRCDAALHACVECGSTQDCGSNAVCEPSTRKCIPTCVQDSNCPASTPHCKDSRCFECASHDDCHEPRKACQRASGRCVECESEKDCSESKVHCDLATSRCVTCRNSSDCSPSAPTCDPATNTCVP